MDECQNMLRIFLLKKQEKKLVLLSSVQQQPVIRVQQFGCNLRVCGSQIYQLRMRWKVLKTTGVLKILQKQVKWQQHWRGSGINEPRELQCGNLVSRWSCRNNKTGAPGFIRPFMGLANLFVYLPVFVVYCSPPLVHWSQIIPRQKVGVE